MEWRKVPGFSRYSVSEIGQVRVDVCGKRGRKATTLKQHRRGGYCFVTLRSDDGRSVRSGVHRWVALAFLGLPPSPEQNQAAHRNGLRCCNHFTNLRWSTAKENAADRTRHGTTRRGSNHGRTRLTEDQVIAIRSTTTPLSDLAKQFGVSPGTISQARSGKNWAHLPNAGGWGMGKGHLTQAQALEIVWSDEPRSVLAKRFDLTPDTVTRIKTGKTWRHLDRPKRAA